ncbi:hypothetical protein C7M84_017488 [Penaeus vannamei]|uniref:Uncharacterized protein n=1 Tax=Penaeus vannamei TaxID=6689 RepID=A0A3R7LVZ4_PENVA|nr:hypothetical protein C7M84_017488 [Penaeus vannamei]
MPPRRLQARQHIHSAFLSAVNPSVQRGLGLCRPIYLAAPPRLSCFFSTMMSIFLALSLSFSLSAVFSLRLFSPRLSSLLSYLAPLSSLRVLSRSCPIPSYLLSFRTLIPCSPHPLTRPSLSPSPLGLSLPLSPLLFTRPPLPCISPSSPSNLPFFAHLPSSLPKSRPLADSSLFPFPKLVPSLNLSLSCLSHLPKSLLLPRNTVPLLLPLLHLFSLLLPHFSALPFPTLPYTPSLSSPLSPLYSLSPSPCSFPSSPLLPLLSSPDRPCTPSTPSPLPPPPPPELLIGAQFIEPGSGLAGALSGSVKVDAALGWSCGGRPSITSTPSTSITSQLPRLPYIISQPPNNAPASPSPPPLPTPLAPNRPAPVSSVGTSTSSRNELQKPLETHGRSGSSPLRARTLPGRARDIALHQ